MCVASNKHQLAVLAFQAVCVSRAKQQTLCLLFGFSDMRAGLHSGAETHPASLINIMSLKKLHPKWETCRKKAFNDNLNEL